MTTPVIERRLTSSPSATSGTVPKLSSGSRFISGYAAVFYRPGEPGTEYRLGPDTIERIAPTAFNRAIRERHDVRGLFNHDSNMLLGRTASGTMRLSVDSTGLRYEIDADPQSPLHQTVLRMLQRGDLSGSSFQFAVTKHSVARAANGSYIRTIEDFNLYDVGPVAFPAYSATTSAARGSTGVDSVERFQVLNRLKQIERDRQQLPSISRDEVKARLRQIEDQERRERINALCGR